MWKKRFDSCWLHYALLALLLAGGTTGGLILLGCDLVDAQGSEVEEPSQRDGEGGILFSPEDPRQEAKTTVSPTVDGEEVQWYVPKYQYAWIEDAQKSNQIIVVRPPDDVREAVVTIEGDYEKDGTGHHVTRHIRIQNYPRP